MHDFAKDRWVRQSQRDDDLRPALYALLVMSSSFFVAYSNCRSRLGFLNFIFRWALGAVCLQKTFIGVVWVPSFMADGTLLLLVWC